MLLGLLTVGAGIGLGFGIAAEPSHSTGLGPTVHVVAEAPATAPGAPS